MNGYKEGMMLRMTVQDKIETIGKGSLVHHGKENDRVYLMKMQKEDFPEIIDTIQELAKQYNYSKLVCKVPFWAAPSFMACGYMQEARIPNFYNGNDDMFFMSKFLGSDRIMYVETEKLNALSDVLKVQQDKTDIQKSDDGIRLLQPDHAEQITMVYSQVFESYPFPIFNPDYIRETMEDHIMYYGIFENGNLIAVASAEIDWKSKNAEMTDFATLPLARGRGYAISILNFMESEMKNRGIATLYTIARTNSIPMNKTFLRLQYTYAGTLIKNTNIAGKIESMNIYYKNL